MAFACLFNVGCIFLCLGNNFQLSACCLQDILIVCCCW